MKGRTLLAAVFFAIGLAAGWMAWLTWKADADGKWLFGVFAVFFFILAAAPFLPASKKKKAPVEARGTSFAPAWWLPVATLMLLGLLVLGLIGHFVHPAK
ncbi:MAG TPA: hypothetical protein VK785_03930 [Opitutaceae bacterium]|jgi:hypothetical protein|nr:hypothetical protein [Opitutaceae bacterium]